MVFVCLFVTAKLKLQTSNITNERIGSAYFTLSKTNDPVDD
jgi:hypothetical protein